MKRFSQAAPVLIGFVFLFLLGYLQRERALAGLNDFTAFYTAAHLAGTPDLYSKPANLDFIRSLHGLTLENVVYIRPPFYAALLKPLAALPYLHAYALFSLATFASFVWFVFRFSRQSPEVLHFAAFSIPFISALCGGQDTPFLLLSVGASILLNRGQRPFAAGVALSLCLLKFHLFLFVPVFLVLKRQWAVLAGGICGSTALFAVGMLVNGPQSTILWLNVLRDPWINASAAVMPNIHGLTSILGAGAWLDGVLILLVVLGFLWVARRTDNYEYLFALSLVCGLLVSYHSSVVDDLLLLAVFAMVVNSTDSKPLRILSALLLTPIPYLFTLAQAPPFNLLLPLALLAYCGLAVHGIARLKPLAPPRLEGFRRPGTAMN